MAQKTLLEDTDDSVEEMIKGISAVHPGLSVIPENGITFLNKNRENKVAIITGGGSGHEPFPAGFIADNMITGSVSGHIFTSPSTTNISAAITILSTLNQGGVLLAVLNYTGDQLNFGLAIERAKNKGIQVEQISISDDVALINTDHASIIGNRGISGCAFIFKLLGAMSNRGDDLQQLKTSFNEMTVRLASMGACLSPCHLPNSKDFLFHLGEDEISLGCGVHGEAGISTLKMCSVRELVSKILNKIYESGVIKSGNKSCVLIGNLGSLTLMECYIIANETKNQLNQKGIITERLYVGTVMSSLDMKGFQISVLNIDDKEEWLSFLDEPTPAFGWPGTSLSFPKERAILESFSLITAVEENLKGPKLTEEQSIVFKRAVVAACENLKVYKDKINELDSGCGDGDCGSTLTHFSNAILSKQDTLPWMWAGSCLHQMSSIAESVMGGTSGAVYSLLLAGSANGISQSWEAAWLSALQTLYNYSPARIGHRTMIDAFAPAYTAFTTCPSTHRDWKVCLKQAVEASEMGCRETSTMKAKVGRACYAEDARLTDVDAGAFGVTIWLKAVYDVLKTVNL